MAITFVSQIAVELNGAASKTRPAGQQTGDTLISCVVADFSDALITPPAGHTAIVYSDPNDLFQPEIRFYYQVVGASPPSAETWTISGQGGANNIGRVVQLLYRGADAVAPHETSSAASSTICPAVTAAAATDMLICVYAGGGCTSFTPPTGMTERVDSYIGAGSGTGIGAAELQLSGTGTTGTKTATPAASAIQVVGSILLQVSVPSDTTPPTYGVNPHSTTITNTTAQFQATASDETASSVDHYMAIYAAASTPTAANVKAATGTGFVAGSNRSSTSIANGVTSAFTQVTGLTAATSYRAAFTVEEAGGGNLRTVFYVDFKTAPTLIIGTIGHLTVHGDSVLIGATPVVTKVSFTITQAWNSSLYTSKTAIGYAIFPFNHSTQAVGTMFVNGTAETTDGSGLIEIVTTTIGKAINDPVMVVFWKLGGGPSGEDIAGIAWPNLVAGP